jgi:hypothetical protein
MSIRKVRSSLVVDPLFIRSKLSEKVQTWYDRMKSSITAGAATADTWASEDDSFSMGRQLNEYFSALLMAIRSTGDVFFLEEVYDLWLLSKADLEDSYCEGATGSYSSPDGYLNWRWREDPGNTTFYCMDEHTMDDLMTHGGWAAVAYAFHVNRHIDPKYGVEADYIVDYLENHYLAKWYSRDGTTGTPEVSWQANNGVYRRFTHPSMNQLRLGYYLWKITGDKFYYDRWTTMAGNLDVSHMEVNIVDASGYQWEHHISGAPVEVQRMTYIKYYMGGVLELWCEYIDWTFRDISELTKVMIGLREAVFKKFGTPWTNMADQIDGSGSTSMNMYRLTGFIRWDGFETGELDTIAEAVYSAGTAGVSNSGGALIAYSDRLFKHIKTSLREGLQRRVQQGLQE